MLKGTLMYYECDFDCHIVANNNADFVIADDIKSGNVPMLVEDVTHGGAHSSSNVEELKFDIDECCQKNDLFRVKLRKVQESLKTSSSLQRKFEAMQDFIEEVMPWCEPSNVRERTECFMDGEPFSYMVEHKMCMCAERAALAQYLCQESGIKSYLVNSFVDITSGEKGPHAYVMFEDNNQMFVYDPANPTKNSAPRIMATKMDKAVFDDFIDVINHNADCSDIKQKNGAGFRCEHSDGKKFLYRNYCGTKDNTFGPSKLKKLREAAKFSAMSEKALKIGELKENTL